MKRYSVLILALLLCIPFLFGAAGAGSDTELFDNGQAADEMKVAPSVVFSVEDYETLTGMYEAAAKPEIAMVTLLADGSISLADKAGYSLTDFYEEVRGEVIPAVRISTQAEAETLEAFLQENDCRDLFAVSDSAESLLAVRTAFPNIRGIFDARGRDLSEKGAGFAVAGEACAAMAQIVLLGDNATRQNVYEIQGRALLAWIEAEDTEVSLYTALMKGPYGIVAQDYAALNQIYAGFSSGSLCRASYIIGHRGYPDKYNENSMEGIFAAYDAGASHTEIDVHLTIDGEIVIMHDAQLERTTNGEGNIEQMTLAEIRQYRLDDKQAIAGTSEIPILDDVLEKLTESGYEDKMLAVEIKQSSAELITAIAELLKEFPSVRDRLVFIAFDHAMLEELFRQIPDIPRGYLETVDRDNFRETLSPVNAFIDGIYTSSLITESNADMLKNRGYAVWAWTYNDSGSLSLALQTGYSGLTTNDITDASAKTMFLEAAATIDRDELSNGFGAATVITYGGARKKVTNAQYVKIADTDEGEVGLFKYGRYYSEPVLIPSETADGGGENEPNPPVDDDQKDGGTGCGSNLGTVQTVLFSLTAAGAALGAIAIKRRA